jgi:hypothetical protein
MVLIWCFLYSLFTITQPILSLHNRYKYGILLQPNQIVNPNLQPIIIKLGTFWELGIVGVVVGVGIGVLIQLGIQYQRVSIDGEWFRTSIQCTVDSYLQ